MLIRLFVGVALVTALAALGGEANAAPALTGNYIVVLKDIVDDPGAVAAKHAKDHGGLVSQVYRHALKGYAVTLPLNKLAALRANPLVRFVSEDGEFTVAAKPPPPPPSCPPACALPTGVDRIDGDLSSAAAGDGQGSVNINVAVLDTGIDVDHPDLNVVGGNNCTPERSFDDGDGHGTHVAGIIGALDNGFGVVGVAPGARLWAVKVLKDNGSGRESMILCGIDWVTSTRTDADPGNDIAVANMSLGGFVKKEVDETSCGGELHLAICNSIAAGVTYVASAGNEARDLDALIPARYDEILAVTAVADFDGIPGGLGSPTCGDDLDDTFVDFSNFATLPTDQAHTIAAPGRCIYSTFLGGGYATISGTSMASPTVAGVAALCIASGACAGLTPAQIIQKLRSDAEAYNIAHPEYGFAGDPLRPEAGKYFGYLIRAGQY